MTVSGCGAKGQKSTDRSRATSSVPEFLAMEWGEGSSEDLALMTEAAGGVRMVWPPLSCWGSLGWDDQAHNQERALAGGEGERDHRVVYMSA